MKKMVLLIAALMSVAGSQLMADCTACAMKHGASKEERKAHRDQQRENRKKRKQERKAKKQNKKRHHSQMQ